MSEDGTVCMKQNLIELLAVGPFKSFVAQHIYKKTFDIFVSLFYTLLPFKVLIRYIFLSFTFFPTSYLSSHEMFMNYPKILC